VLLVRLGEEGESGGPHGFLADHEMVFHEEEPTEIVIAPLGASTDGGPVSAFEPLGFLQ